MIYINEIKENKVARRKIKKREMKMRVGSEQRTHQGEKNRRQDGE